MLRQENDRLRNEKYILKHPEILKEKHFIEINNYRLGAVNHLWAKAKQ